MARTELVIGRRAPGFSLPDSSGSLVSLSDFIGSRVIVYFYPAAGTPGCTTQACDFRESFSSFQSAGYAVVGVSKDPPEKLAEFANDQGLTFPLLSDSDLKTHIAYGAYGEKLLYGKKVTGVIRSTFVVAEDGKLLEARYNVKVSGHVAGLRKRLGISG